MFIVRLSMFIFCLTHSEWHASIDISSNLNDRTINEVLQKTIYKSDIHPKMMDSILLRQTMLCVKRFSSLGCGMSFCYLWRTTGSFRIGLSLTLYANSPSYCKKACQIQSTQSETKQDAIDINKEFALHFCIVVLYKTRIVDILREHGLYSISYENHMISVDENHLSKGLPFPKMERMKYIWANDIRSIVSYNSISFISKPKKYHGMRVSLYLKFIHKQSATNSDVVNMSIGIKISESDEF